MSGWIWRRRPSWTDLWGHRAFQLPSGRWRPRSAPVELSSMRSCWPGIANHRRAGPSGARSKGCFPRSRSLPKIAIADIDPDHLAMPLGLIDVRHCSGRSVRPPRDYQPVDKHSHERGPAIPHDAQRLRSMHRVEAFPFPMDTRTAIDRIEAGVGDEIYRQVPVELVVLREFELFMKRQIVVLHRLLGDRRSRNPFEEHHKTPRIPDR